MPDNIKQDESADETTTLSIGDYIIELSLGNKKGNPFELIEKLYILGKDRTMNREEKDRDLKAIIREYMHNH